MSEEWQSESEMEDKRTEGERNLLQNDYREVKGSMDELLSEK